MSPEVRAARRRLAVRAAARRSVWSLGLMLTAVLIPLYNGQTSSDANGLTLSTATYVQRNGAWVLIPLAAATARRASSRWWPSPRPAPGLRRAAQAAVASVAVLGLVLVTSGGILLLPVAILLAAAVALTRPASPARPTHAITALPPERPPQPRAEDPRPCSGRACTLREAHGVRR